MSFFRRNNESTPSIPPVNEPNRFQRAPPPQDRYGAPAPDRYGAPPPDRYGAPPPDRYGAAPDRYGAAPDRYGAAPDRYGQPQQQQNPPQRYGAPPAQDRYAQQQQQQQQPDRYGQQQPDRFARSSPAPPGDRYGASGNAPDRYGQSSSPAPSGGMGSRRVNASDPYSRGDANVDADRAALFAGRNPDAPRRLQEDGPRFRSEADWDKRREEGGDEEEDIEAIKTSIRQTKQESLASTRNALRIAREAEETGMNTLLKLGDQSEKLGDTGVRLDNASMNSYRASDKADELKQLNKSIFRPVIVFNKDKKRAAQENKMMARQLEAKEERERTAAEVRDSQNRIGGVSMNGYGGGYNDDGYGGPGGSDAPSRGGGYRTQMQEGVRKEQRKRFQFEASASDDEIEDNIDQDLEDISSTVANLKKLGLAMGQEVDRQNTRIDTLIRKTDKVDNQVITNTNKLRKY